MRDGWIEAFKQVNSAVWKIAREEAPSSNDTSGEFEKNLTSLFPWMSAKALQRAHFLAAYYAHHEGYTRV
jgi:hypothetical protein